MATHARDPYEVLGVERDADDATIKKAFRKLARELHPDVNRHDPDAEEKFKEAAEAYEILNDAERRATYDRYGHDGLRSGGFSPNFEGFGSISDLFDAFFGGAGGGIFGGFGGAAAAAGPTQGRDIAVHADITLADAAAGTSVELSFEAIETCEVCHGNGAKPGTPIVTCERCGGVGVLQQVTRSPFGQVMRQTACDVCGGEGKIPSEPCERCEGRGREVRRRTLRVDVPEGIADGQRIRLSGRGHAGERGGPPGDLYVLVRIAADDRFLRDGDDLVTALDISAPHAALGASFKAPSLDGEVEVRVAPGTQPGEVIVVRGHGMPRLRRPGRRGDLRVVVNVVVPRKLSREQRKLAEKLADSMTDANVSTDESLVGKLKRLIGA
jgi:molecular chaperone DnaJ